VTDQTRADTAHEPDLNLLAAHADGRLDAGESAKLVAHLGECRPCRETAALMARGLGDETTRRAALPSAAGWLALAATLLLATIVGIRVSRVGPSPAPPPVRAPEPSQRSAAAEAPPAAETTAPPAPPVEPAEPPDVRRGGNERKVSGKTFRLVAGEWIDSAYDATAGLPVVEAAGAAARRQLSASHPALAPYLAVGDRVLVVLDGTVYRALP